MSLHALARLQERYNPSLTFADLDGMRDIIMSGQAKFVGTPHPRAQEFLVPYNGRRFRLVCDPNTRSIITALPLKGGSRPKDRMTFQRGRKMRIEI